MVYKMMSLLGVISFLSIFLNFRLAGGIATIATSPLEVIKTRLQVNYYC